MCIGGAVLSAALAFPIFWLSVYAACGPNIVSCVMLRSPAIAIVMMNVSLVPELFRTRARYSGAGKTSSSLAVRVLAKPLKSVTKWRKKPSLKRKVGFSG
jgi:hypothetical protein